MKYILLLILFFLGCSEKKMATSVVDLAGNMQIVGWNDSRDNEINIETILPIRIHFDKGSYFVKDVYYKDLEKLAKILNNNPNLKVKIVGYTDDMGDSINNLKLSKKRAESVKDILINSYDVSANQIILKWYGEDKPLFDNTSQTNRILNRRVEIIPILTSH